MDKIQSLRGLLAKGSPVLLVTRDQLTNSEALRKQIIETPLDQYYLFSNSAMEFHKRYDSPQQAKHDLEDSWNNSSLKALTQERTEIQKHNVQLLNEYKEGEEGIDSFPHMKDKRVADINKIKRDLRSHINSLKVNDPLLAKEYQRVLFEKDELDTPPEIDPLTIVKYYPGSPKGPKPEDDPKHYSEWFMRNQPIDALYGKNASPDFRDIGARWKYVFSKNEIEEDAMHVESKDDV